MTDMIETVGLTEFRKNLRKYLKMLVEGWLITLVDKRRNKEVATLQHVAHD